MSKLLSFCAVIFLAASSFAAPPASRIYRSHDLTPLTGPSNESRADVVRAFLASNGQGAAARTLVSAGENRQDGVTHIRMSQVVGGLTVYGAYVKAAVDDSGRLRSVVENVVTPSAVRRTRLSEADAFAAAVAYHYPGRTRFDASFWYRAPSSLRVAVPVRGGLEEGFLVETWERDSNILWHTVIGADGDVVDAELRTNTDTYKIFPDQPARTSQTVVSGPGLGNAYSPEGWLVKNTSTTTIGNNVDAYLDRDNNNAADTGGRPVSSTQNFEYTADLTQDPTVSINQQAAVTNLFYFNNVIHDKLYRHGFNEAAGNFQTNNFSKGGSGNDPVNAEAQDGGGTNNANFATPADGSRPRMQMYLWTYSTPNRDGDLDSDIIWHEYGHGLTWRMIGSMSGPLAGAIGEGMSDTLSIYMNRNDVVGEYSYNNAGGIRRYPYTNYPLTYGDVTGSSVHSDGEIYAATMWYLLALWEQKGYTQDRLFDYVVDGMNFTPSRPAYEDMRDGILASSDTQAEDCVIWEAFAQFGIGEGADGQESCMVVRCSVSITESFVVPSVCSGGTSNTAPSVQITSPANNSSFDDTASVSFSGSASDEDGDLSGSLAWTSSIDNAIGSGASFSTSDLSVGTHTITAAVTDSGGLQGSSSITITITDSSTPPPAGITLTATGYKVKGVKTVDLAWSGATSTDVDVYRDNTRIATTPNDGAYTDSTGQKGGGSLTYRVCEAGRTDVCSNNATVSF